MFIKSKAYCSALSFTVLFAKVETKDMHNEIRLQSHNPGFGKHFREYCFSGKNGMLVTNNTMFWNPFKARALGTAFLQHEWLCPSLHHHVPIYNYMDVREIWTTSSHNKLRVIVFLNYYWSITDIHNIKSSLLESIGRFLLKSYWDVCYLPFCQLCVSKHVFI